MMELVVNNSFAFIAGAIIGSLGTFIPLVMWVAVGGGQNDD